MSKRNFILLIIVLVIGGSVAYFWYSGKSTPLPGNNEVGPNFVSQFNPFGTGSRPGSSSGNPTDVSGYQPGEEGSGTQSGDKLSKISNRPIAGFTVFSKERLKEVAITTPDEASADTKKATKPTAPPTEFVPALRYVDRATGNIYQTFVDKITEERFSSTIIPKVYDAYFGNNALGVVMRYLKSDGRTIESFAGTLPKEILGADSIRENEVKGSFLPDNVKDLSLSPDGSKLFYLFENGDDMVGATFTFSTSSKTQVIDSPFTEWLSQWPSGNLVTLTTKPSSNIPGYMYSLDLTKKTLTKTLGDINGLTTLTSPSGKLVLYSDGNLSLYLNHTDTRNSDLLGVKTLPEKCVWGKVGDSIYCAVPKTLPFGEYPDTWYQGEVSFNDQIWKIDVKTGNATMLADPATVSPNTEVDATKLALDSGENYLFFVNKKDSTLWKLDLK